MTRVFRILGLWKRRRIVGLVAPLSVGVVVLLATCAKPPRMPVVDGAVIEIRRSDGDLRPGEAGYASTLQLYWFGTACHLIRLGDLSVLTDPFVTNDLKLFGMESDPGRVAATLGRIPPPDGVLVNHSHHDHILDAYAAMALSSWREREVPLYGGRSGLNVLAGFDGGSVDPRWHTAAHGERFRIAGGKAGSYAEITPFQTRHSPHLKCGYTFADGLVEKPRTSPPRKLTDFQSGEVFNYLIEMHGPGGARCNVFYLGAPFDLGVSPESLPPVGTRIDVAIILAPSADNIPGYPEKHLARLRARQLVLSHFNTFVREDPDEQLAIAGRDVVKMPKLSRDLQAAFARNPTEYPEFEKLHIPAITRIEGDGRVRNVIRIR